MSKNRIERLREAASLRVSGFTWEQVAYRVKRKANTCASWPRRYADEWGPIYREAAAVRFESINTQAHRAMNDLLIDGEWRTRLKCVEVWLRSGAVAYGRSKAFAAPSTSPRLESKFDDALAAIQRDLERLRLEISRPVEAIVDRPKVPEPTIVGAQYLGGIAAIVLAVAGLTAIASGRPRAESNVGWPKAYASHSEHRLGQRDVETSRVDIGLVDRVETRSRSERATRVADSLRESVEIDFQVVDEMIEVQPHCPARELRANLNDLGLWVELVRRMACAAPLTRAGSPGSGPVIPSLPILFKVAGIPDPRITPDGSNIHGRAGCPPVGDQPGRIVRSRYV